jgi:hypothetical protein
MDAVRPLRFQTLLESQRRKPLIGAGAVVVQNLSCGYYMLFFTPFVVAYCLRNGGARIDTEHRRLAIVDPAAAGVALPPGLS